MSSENEIASGVFAWTVAWWRGLVQTVPPDLAWCEFECRTPTCAAERFDACNNRLEYVVQHSAVMRPPLAATLAAAAAIAEGATSVV